MGSKVGVSIFVVKVVTLDVVVVVISDGVIIVEDDSKLMVVSIEVDSLIVVKGDIVDAPNRVGKREGDGDGFSEEGLA